MDDQDAAKVADLVIWVYSTGDGAERALENMDKTDFEDQYADYKRVAKDYDLIIQDVANNLQTIVRDHIKKEY